MPSRDPKGPGRPHKLLSSPDMEGGGRELTAEICELIRAGNYPEVAALRCGVSRTRFYEWRRKGEDQRREEQVSAFTEFCDEIEMAIADSECKVVEIIERALPQDPRLAMEYLGRRFSKRWAKPRDQGVVTPESEGAASAKKLSDMISDIATGVAARPLPAKSATTKNPASKPDDENTKDDP